MFATVSGFRAGICSVTLRAASPDGVIRTVSDAGLVGIEWGGDVHVDPARPGLAREVGRATRQAGLDTLALGSYFRAEDVGDFAAVLEATVELGAPRVRVWAGTRASADADRDYRDHVASVLRSCAAAASDRGVEVGVEFHGGTLTDSAASTADLLDSVAHDSVRTYWQPPVGMPDDEALDGLRSIRERVCAAHVFAWWPQRERLPLDARAALWVPALQLLRDESRPLDLLLEFVRDDDPAQVVADARTLLGWISQV
jgi:3-dehydroshikimate dehydratase